MGTVAEQWGANALWPGQAIVGRLRATVADLRAVLLLDEFDAGTTVPRQLPSAVVLLDSLRVVQRPGGAYGLPINCEQDWMVAIAVRSARAEADAASALAGALLPQVVAALHGWMPDGTVRPLTWRTGPRPNYGRDVSYYPLIFSLQETMA
ncbi:MAG TPA: hypothetical protein PKE15_00255 [Ottowia sp.]|nr:hypothetical protein [Ottowia sp.]